MPSLFISIAFMALVASLGSAGKLPSLVPSLYLSVSIVTFALYAIDKRAARNDLWRIRERTLHLLSLAGGWPGALSAQQLLRHKNQKRSFQLLFRLTVLVNCSIFLSFLFSKPLWSGIVSLF